MRIDLLAGTMYALRNMVPRAPTILVFDSGLGGLTVLAEVRKARPDARFVYAADDAGFPYGRLDEQTLVARVMAVMERLIAQHAPDLVVIACNTASTLVLPHLRQRFPMPFVGTVPAIKPAAGLSRSKRVSVLATPGTVARDYTRGLIEAYAGDCRVTLVGSRRLAALAEAELGGIPAADADIRAEIEPCFVADAEGRTDVVVLACTHYPLLLPRLERLAPWPVTWVDPAPAIARRVVQLLGETPSGRTARNGSLAVFTDGAAVAPGLRGALAERGLATIASEPMPLAGAGALTFQA
ncbi:MAG TPA: glutamate racemase [Beijerinckiaceae bacterium]|nr:glutamate racemase [Beijerinckiaceae bacterium]